MLDVNSGSMVRDPVILIQGDKITSAGSSVKVPAEAEVVDLGDATLLPGLIDCHTHPMARMSDDPGLTSLTKSQAFRATPEQIGHSPNLLKVYADWGAPTLTIEEIRPIVEEAHKSKIKMAAHADSPEGIRNALTAGVDAIEHGHQADRSAFELMKQKNAFRVPTKGH